MRFLELLPLFLVLIIVVAAVVAIIAWRRREATPEPDPGIGTVRRLYFYIVTFVALMMSASGVVLVIQFILDEVFGGTVIRPSTTQLATGGALTIVGLPLWLLHWTLIQRYVRDIPVERRSLIRKFFIYLALGVSGAAVLISAVNLLQWAFGTERFNGYHWGAIIIWSAVWYFYWRVEQGEGQPTPDTLGIRRLYLYLVSLVTLSMAAIGAGRVIHILLLEGYDALFGTVLLPVEAGIWRPALRDMLALAMVGAPAWAAHWLVFARHDYGSALRQAYLYIYAILGGVVTALVSLGVIMFGTLSWLLDVPGTESASGHFRFLPGALASLTIGLGLWLYHWGVVQREAAVSRYESQGARRSYAYIMSALGLVALGVAAGILVNTALGLIIEGVAGELIAGRDLWRGPVTAVITLAILGGPIWGYYWTTTQRQVEAVGAEERLSLARRIFIFALLGVGVLALLGSASATIFIFLRDLLETGLSLNTARDIRGPLSIIVAVAIFLPYYWKVYQRDREAEAQDVAAVGRRVRKEVSVLANSGGQEFVRQLEAALGYRVNVLQWADPDADLPPLSEAEAQELAQRVNAAPGSRVLLVTEGIAVRVLSYN